VIIMQRKLWNGSKQRYELLYKIKMLPAFFKEPGRRGPTQSCPKSGLIRAEPRTELKIDTQSQEGEIDGTCNLFPSILAFLETKS